MWQMVFVSKCSKTLLKSTEGSERNIIIITLHKFNAHLVTILKNDTNFYSCGERKSTIDYMIHHLLSNILKTIYR